MQASTQISLPFIPAGSEETPSPWRKWKPSAPVTADSCYDVSALEAWTLEAEELQAISLCYSGLDFSPRNTIVTF